MESDDDYQQITPPEEPSSPIHQRKLKRLTKATRVLNIPIAQVYTDSIPSLEVDDIPINSDLESSKPVLEDSIGKMEVLEDGSASPNELGELFEYRDRAEDEAMYNVEEVDRLADSAEEKFGKNQSNPGDEFGEDKAKSVKKRPSLKEGQVEEKKNNKTNKRSKKTADDNGNSEASVRTKKKLEKERKTHLQQLHAESQRLLRETRDAAFKPVPLVQKPISSILEKIRQRKLEVSKKVSMLNNHGAKEVMTDLYFEQVGNGNLEDKEHAVVTDLYSEQVGNGNLEDKEHAEHAEKDTHQHEDSNSVDVIIMESSSESACILSSSKNICSSTALDGESKSAFRAPIDDTQDLFDDSDQSDGEDSQDSQEENLLEVLAPSVLTMNLKLDSAPIDDVSQENDDSDEENYDKENIDPHPDKQIDRDSNPKFDPVKAFVDDEAEEEDDSDNDLMRVKDNEEDEENEDGEEFNDLIVTGYKEKPSDNVKRDQLHQMWLEQQDATATDNVLQRLKCNENQHRAPIALEEVEDEDDGDFSEGSMDVAADDLHPRRVARINSIKMKQMIPQMFTDKDDVYLSSDDEETEQKLVKMRFLEKAEEHTSFSYPAEDENSREVFGLIKKVNIAPDLKKKSKSSSYFDTSITGGNSNSLSKSSFLGRASNSSLPSSNKTGSSSFRSFIFSRDDSNSRSAITATEAFSDVGENLNLPTKTTRAKFSNSQSKFNSQSTSQTSSSSSLFEHLRRSTQIDHAVRNSSIAETQVAVQFAAFKSAKKSIKTKA